jgi:hypothetical protein
MTYVVCFVLHCAHQLLQTALIIPTKSDIDVFVSQKMSNQIWNLEYIDLAHLLYKNFVSNIDKPKKVLGFDEDGDILIKRSIKSLASAGIFLVKLLYNSKNPPTTLQYLC